DLAEALGADLGFATVDELHDQLVAAVPAFAPATTAALRAKRDGVLLEQSAAPSMPAAFEPSDLAVPATRNSYDLRLLVSRRLYAAGAAPTASPSLSGLAAGGALHVHPLDLDRLGASTGTLLKVSTARTSAVVVAEADRSVPRGLAWMPFNQADAAAA